MSVQRRDLFYLLYIYIYLEISVYTIYLCLTGVLADLRPGDVFLVFLVQFLFTERVGVCFGSRICFIIFTLILYIDVCVTRR